MTHPPFLWSSFVKGKKKENGNETRTMKDGSKNTKKKRSIEILREARELRSTFRRKRISSTLDAQNPSTFMVMKPATMDSLFCQRARPSVDISGRESLFLFSIRSAANGLKVEIVLPIARQSTPKLRPSKIETDFDTVSILINWR
jgi:hypothetical protein